MSVSAEELPAGPRGRRLLWEFALRSAERAPEESGNFGEVVRRVRRRFDPDGGGQPYIAATSSSATRWLRRARPSLLPHRFPRLWWPKKHPGRRFRRYRVGGVPETEQREYSPHDVAALLAKVPLITPDEEVLLRSLADAVDHARYWQEPDGDDVLAATPAVRDALDRIAAHIMTTSATDWWYAPIARDDQWEVHWIDGKSGLDTTDSDSSPARRLVHWRIRTLEGEERARRQRPRDPSAPFSGEWWSTPPRELTRSTRNLGASGPAGLWLVEDRFDWDRATVGRVDVPEPARIYEIDGADAWAELCRQSSLEVTAAKRHDWYRTTGRVGRWVVPDWSHLAKDYDGVHLTTGGYLAAAGTAIPVHGDSASVIAGWDPDETYWLTDRVTARSDRDTWVRESETESETWRPATESAP